MSEVFFVVYRQRGNERGTRELDRQNGAVPKPAGEEGYDPQWVETKWQQKWAQTGIHHTDLDAVHRPHYNLTEFPYPSAEGLHVGHVSTYSGADAYGRMMRMRGYQVFQPMGWDAFGIHSENYALKARAHPATIVPRNIARFRQQLERIGAAFDWSREVDTTSPDYYRWTQWIFCQLLKGDLAYKAERAVNWCPTCKTSLAHEQVIQGKCERCRTLGVQHRLPQWFLRITTYADRLLDFSGGDFSQTTRTLQRHWIGRREGARISFALQDGSRVIEVFTTRAETLYGATFVALAPEHPLAASIAARGKRPAILAYCQDVMRRTVRERHAARSSEGMDTGAVAVNPVNGRHLPVFVADYVMADSGSGAIFGVPAHDSRDHAFAIVHHLPIVSVVSPTAGLVPVGSGQAFTEPGVLVNSGPYTGLSTESARKAIVSDLNARGIGTDAVTYRLHDWNISRQRYWGPPIPVISCPICGDLPVPDGDLPVLLPKTNDYRPIGDGQSPLALLPGFANVTCPQCGGPARRETDVSDNFLDSSWYFMRYLCSDCSATPWREDRLRRWLPVGLYFGGQEHSTMHHLYARFVWKALQDLGHLPQALGPEPFAKLRLHGLIVKDGHKMSKSRGNVVNPDDYISRYGADALRVYLLFMAPFARGGDFRNDGIHGVTRFLAKVHRTGLQPRVLSENLPASELVQARHHAVQGVTRDVEKLDFNTAIAELMSYLSLLVSYQTKAITDVWNECWSAFLRLLAPFAPHIAEEMWERQGGPYSVHQQPWPDYQPVLARPRAVTIAVQIDGRLRERIEVSYGMAKPEILKVALGCQKIRDLMAGRMLVKVIHVPDRIINLVTQPM